MNMMRTNIVATMGPAVRNEKTLVELFAAGVAVCRLNFSHGSLEEHAGMLGLIRQAVKTYGKPVAVLGDLCGPKIRLGKIADIDGLGGMAISTGEELVVQRAVIEGKDGRVSSTYAGLVDDVEVGHRVYVEDGMLRFVCIDKAAGEIRLSCTAGGVLKTGKGINLPSTHVNIPSITDRDWQCVAWAIENDLDYLALSFVRSADDLLLLRQHLRNHECFAHLVAKIEKAEAVAKLDEILDAADALMIARGDLGVEVDVAQVPILQKQIIEKCRRVAKPVIVATQMLQSMIDSPSPTRAEVSDVANAIFDGADAVMLSGETSVGKFPLLTVHTMAHVVATTEAYIDKEVMPRPMVLDLRSLHLSSAVAKGVWQMVRELKAKLVVIWSQTGATARVFSKLRFGVPLVALSSDERSLRQMRLMYGVQPLQAIAPKDMNELIASVDVLLQLNKLAETGDRVVVVAGASMGTPGLLSGVIIHTVDQAVTGGRTEMTAANAALVDYVTRRDDGEAMQ
jgi:pyruvate kinase